jgi:glycosyltransferase involved in cell wall biosynthesis
MIDFSVIIPQRDSLETLPVLLKSIPRADNIEIIIVDNSPNPITKEEIVTDRPFSLYWSSPDRHAGGARNVGIEHAIGKWLLFADADDYYVEDAFEAFNKYKESEADIVYFGMTGIYMDTGEYSNRGEKYTRLVREYLRDNSTEDNLRLTFNSPCSKMVKRSFVEKHHLRFDEVRASNDVYFSTTAGYYASSIEADEKEVYVATVSQGTLTRRRTYDVSNARYLVTLKRNKFLREHGFAHYQTSVLVFFYQAKQWGFSVFIKMVKNLFEYKQNPFTGWHKWFSHYKKYSSFSKSEDKYIVKE